MVAIPKVLKVYPEHDRLLRVLFDNGVEKRYDCKRVIERFNLQLLDNDAFFKQVHVDPGGYGISWNADIDISEYELWTNSTVMDQVEDDEDVKHLRTAKAEEAGAHTVSLYDVKKELGL